VEPSFSANMVSSFFMFGGFIMGLGFKV
jgi:hypothetical protein